MTTDTLMRFDPPASTAPPPPAPIRPSMRSVPTAMAATWLLGEGRLGRLGYLSVTFMTWLFLAVTASLEPPVVVSLVALVITCVVTMSATIRRLHDLDASGWWVLAMFLPVVNLLIWLSLLFAPGTGGRNRYSRY